MDAIEILGSLLGGKGGGGLGGKILTDLMKGGAKRPAPQQPAPSASGGRSAPRASPPIDLQREASELEDLLNVAQDRNQQRRPTPQQPPPQQPAPQQPTPQHQPAPPRQQVPQPTPRDLPASNYPFSKPATRAQVPPSRLEPTDYRNNPQQQNDDALVLIRAMINAAKSDGDITETERQSIVDRIGNPTSEVVNFLRTEFAQPLDVREFVWSVPLGLEQKVYTMSLAAIELDANHETTYLRELAHGLRLTPDVCNQIHQQFGAPEIF